MASSTISLNSRNTNRPVNILLIEDNRADVVLTKHAIKRARFNHAFHVAQDGQMAIEYLDHCVKNSEIPLPDLIILDINLPRMNGIEVLKKIRSTESLKNLDVAVLTTSENPHEQKTLSDLNVLKCMTKPINHESMSELLSIFTEPGFVDPHKTSTASVKNYTTNPNLDSSIDCDEDSYEDTTEEVIRPTSDLATVLLIEDSLADATLISKRLSIDLPGQFQIIHKSNLREGIELLKELKVDVITLDLGLPDALGLDAFSRVKEIVPDIPIVVLTGVDDSAYALEAVKLGAQDYLVKDSKRYGEVLGRVLLYAIERKKVEKIVQHSLKVEQNTLREVLDEAPIHIIRIDSDLTIRDINPLVENTAQMQESDLIGETITSVLPDLDTGKLEQLVKIGITYDSQQVKIEKFGRSYLNNYYLDIIGWPTQRTLTEEKEAIIICTDVSERVRLANQRDEFIAALAHDIRNPLIGELRVLTGIISGALGVINAPIKSALESLMKSNSSLLLMLTNMLEVYELEASGTTLHLEKMEFGHLVKEVTTEMDYLTIGSNIKLDFEDTSDPTMIEGDETALKRVIQNLAYNAVKYANSNSTITISVTTDDASQVILRVHNQGPKIKDEEKMHLFDRFTKASQGRRYMHSSGLGLYLCKKIVEGHGGIIGCTSDEEGTTFIVSIPRAEL